jgi:hypothetical protein
MSLPADRLTYDAATETLTYHATGAMGLAPARALSKVGRDGTWEGAAVARVAVRFDDQADAIAQADMLGYLEIRSVGPEGEAPSAAFTTRSDFDLDG